MVCAERDPLHQGLIVERSKLQGRGFQVDLASRLGKTQVVTTSTPLNQQVRSCPPYPHSLFTWHFSVPWCLLLKLSHRCFLGVSGIRLCGLRPLLGILKVS